MDRNNTLNYEAQQEYYEALKEGTIVFLRAMVTFLMYNAFEAEVMLELEELGELGISQMRTLTALNAIYTTPPYITFDQAIDLIDDFYLNILTREDARNELRQYFIFELDC
jgi:hypothetical protein